MSRQDHARALQLVRLRDLALDRAMRRLTEATAAAARATAAEAEAQAARDDCAATCAAKHVALTDDPADAPSGLARVARAEARLAQASAWLAAASEERATADLEMHDARAAARRAQARRDAMAGRADRLRRGLAVAAEERVAIEAEEGAAAMRKAA